MNFVIITPADRFSTVFLLVLVKNQVPLLIQSFSLNKRFNNRFARRQNAEIGN